MDSLNFYNISYSVTKDGINFIKKAKQIYIKKNSELIYEFFIDLDEGIYFKILFLKNSIYENLFNYKINGKISNIEVEQDETGIIRKISIYSNKLNYIININEYGCVTEIYKFKVLKNLVKIYDCIEGLCIL